MVLQDVSPKCCTGEQQHESQKGKKNVFNIETLKFVCFNPAARFRTHTESVIFNLQTIRLLII